MTQEQFDKALQIKGTIAQLQKERGRVETGFYDLRLICSSNEPLPCFVQSALEAHNKSFKEEYLSRINAELTRLRKEFYEL